MPAEFSIFLREYENSPNTLWIMKPACKSQGRGIFIVTNKDQVVSWKNSLKGGGENITNELYVVQKYVMNPLLIGGKKFDMRIYAIVTNYNPLTVWLYRTGFARFTHARYSNSADDLGNQYIHLTNVAVQKNCSQYDNSTGGKWDLRNLKIYLYSIYGLEKVNSLFSKIQEIIYKSFVSVSKEIANDRHCFELYGYDILVDDNLLPVLLEINANASLSSNTPADNKMKVAMLDDLMSILDLEKVLSGNETQIGGYDLICKANVPVSQPKYCKYGTRLGSYNNRDTQLKRLASSTYQRLQKLSQQRIIDNAGFSPQFNRIDKQHYKKEK